MLAALIGLTKTSPVSGVLGAGTLATLSWLLVLNPEFGYRLLFRWDREYDAILSREPGTRFTSFSKMLTLLIASFASILLLVFVISLR